MSIDPNVLNVFSAALQKLLWIRKSRTPEKAELKVVILRMKKCDGPFLAQPNAIAPLYRFIQCRSGLLYKFSQSTDDLFLPRVLIRGPSRECLDFFHNFVFVSLLCAVLVSNNFLIIEMC